MDDLYLDGMSCMQQMQSLCSHHCTSPRHHGGGGEAGSEGLQEEKGQKVGRRLHRELSVRCTSYVTEFHTPARPQAHSLQGYPQSRPSDAPDTKQKGPRQATDAYQGPLRSDLFEYIADHHCS